jgi:hypothetical protein
MNSSTLVLGLGGFGSAVVLETKRLYNALPATYRLPAAFLAIDQKDEIDDPGAFLGPEERLALRPRRASEILENLSTTSNSDVGWRELLEWFPDGKPLQLINAVEPCGARQYRPLGRLGLFADDEFIDRAIRRGIQRARCADPSRDPESHVRVALASALSGGAGSGMLLDVAHLARRADELSLLLAYLAIPGSLPDIDASDRGEANTYAALRELVALRTREIEFEVRYERLRPIQPHLNPRRELFARTFLFSSTQLCHEHPGAAHRAAQAIAAQLERRVQGVTICAVQGMARLVDEDEQRIAGPLSFGSCAAKCLTPEEFIVFEASQPKDTSASEILATSVRVAADPSDAPVAEPQAEPGTAPALKPDDLDRWRRTIQGTVEAVNSEVRKEILLRLSNLKASLSRSWIVKASDETELSALEDLIQEEGGDWNVDIRRFFEGHDSKLRSANEAFLSGTGTMAEAAPASIPQTDKETRFFSHWQGIRQNVRQMGAWSRLWLPFRTGLFADRCTALYALVETPEFTNRLRAAIEQHASRLLSEQRSAKVGHATSSGPTSSAPTPASNPFVAESGTSGIEQERVAANQAVRAKLWETHLRRVVGDLREPIFGDREPRPSRRAFLLALVPESFPWPTGLQALRSTLNNAATDIKARSLIEVYSGNSLWLVFEDLFNTADSIRLLSHYKSAYENGELRELYHIDRRWLGPLSGQQRPDAEPATTAPQTPLGAGNRGEGQAEGSRE